MSNTMDHHDEDEFEISAREAEDYVEQRRQKEILDAKMDVRKIITTTKSELARGEIDVETRRAEVRAVVEALLYEIIHIAESSGATYLLREKPLHTIRLSPPAEYVQFVQNNPERVVGSAQTEPKEVYSVMGFEDYLHAPEVVTAEWTANVDLRHSKPQPATWEVSARMPVAASQAVANEARRFLNDVDLDLGPSLKPYKGGEEPGI